MRALVFDRYGPPEQVLRLELVPRPQPQPGEVLVRVRAASLNSWDWDLLTGTPMGRVMGPLRPPFKILGADIAGTVEAVGQGVSAFAHGAPVFADLSGGKWGGLADYVCVPAVALSQIPDGLSFTDAAAIPQAGGLALQALRKFPGLAAGHTLLINGAGGGVGTYAIQMAKAKGATVVAVDRPGKRNALLAVGADAYIDFRSEDYTSRRDSYDFIIDMVTNRAARDYARCLRPGGRMAVVGGTFPGIIGVALTGRLHRGRSLEVVVYKVRPQDNAELAALVRPIIDSSFSLEDGAKAFRRLGDGQHVGKVVVTME